MIRKQTPDIINVALKGKKVFLPNRLSFPDTKLITDLTIRCRADDHAWKNAPWSTKLSITQSIRDVHHMEISSNKYPGFLDELSRYVDYRLDGETTSLKTKREFLVSDHFSRNKRALLGNGPGAFMDGLRDIHRRLGKGSDRFRDFELHTAPDQNGSTVHFPHHNTCRMLIDELYYFLSVYAQTNITLSSLVAYAALLHAHPFTDGNGRTSRVLYSVLNNEIFNSGHFLPIKVIEKATGPSLLMKIRRVFHMSDWAPIQHFFSDAISLSSASQIAPHPNTGDLVR